MAVSQGWPVGFGSFPAGPLFRAVSILARWRWLPQRGQPGEGRLGATMPFVISPSSPPRATLWKRIAVPACSGAGRGTGRGGDE